MNQTVSETLYRKYRPQSFESVVGQDAVISALGNQIKSGVVAHAYLFSGGRGTGKTSIARIFAKELGTDDQDIYEIDAASNRGINEVRQLRDGVSTMPFNSQYRVYIIDEVHMMTPEAFNALLKTLEEPPAHVIFILATTEKQRLLSTIISRCQAHDFALAQTKDAELLIQKIAAAEQRTIDDKSVQKIATLGQGSFRDTLSHLQKIFSLEKTDITYDDVEHLLVGGASEELQYQLLQALSDKNSEDLFAVYQQVMDAGVRITPLVEALLDKMRTVLLLRYSAPYKATIDQHFNQTEIDMLLNYPGISSHTLRDLLQAHELSVQSARPHESFEIFLFEQCKTPDAA